MSGGGDGEEGGGSGISLGGNQLPNAKFVGGGAGFFAGSSTEENDGWRYGMCGPVILISTSPISFG